MLCEAPETPTEWNVESVTHTWTNQDDRDAYSSKKQKVFGVPTLGEGGGVKPVGTKSQVCGEKSRRLPLELSRSQTSTCLHCRHLEWWSMQRIILVTISTSAVTPFLLLISWIPSPQIWTFALCHCTIGSTRKTFQFFKIYQKISRDVDDNTDLNSRSGFFNVHTIALAWVNSGGFSSVGPSQYSNTLHYTAISSGHFIIEILVMKTPQSNWIL